MRFKYDKRKSERLRRSAKRGIRFEEAQELWTRPYYLDQRSDIQEQFRAIGWVGDRLFTVIFEVQDGEYYRLVTFWKSTKEERKLYEESS